jgi:hypothetical protein
MRGFTQLLSNLILENSRFQILYDKLVKPSAKPAQGAEGRRAKGIMDFETLKAIIFADPTTRIPEGLGDIDEISIQDMDKVKVGKYTQWLLKNFVSAPITGEEGEIEKDNQEYKRRFK